MNKILAALCSCGLISISFAWTTTGFRSDTLKNINSYNTFIENLSRDHVFTSCLQYENALVVSTRNRIAILEQMSQLTYKYDTVDQDVGSRFSAAVPQSVIDNAIMKEAYKIQAEMDVLLGQDAQASIELTNAGNRYDNCQKDQLKLYNQYIAEVAVLTSGMKLSEALEILNKAKDLVYTNTSYYSFVLDKIRSINNLKIATDYQTQLGSQKQKDTPSANANNQITVSDQETLASFGIITKQTDEAGYRLNDYISRQEALGIAMKLGQFELSENYVCMRRFSDVSSSKPNSWACRVVETALNSGVISKNKLFRPLDSISKVEALAMLIKAAGITTDSVSDVPSFSDVEIAWQIKVTNTAIDLGFLDAEDKFYPNKKATRSEVFNMARRILEYTK